MLQLANVDHDRKPKLSRSAQRLLRATIGSSRIATRRAITAVSVAAEAVLDAQLMAEAIGDKTAEHDLDDIGDALISYGYALEELRGMLDSVSAAHESKTNALHLVTASAPISATAAK
jgi:hypothetical protein